MSKYDSLAERLKRHVGDEWRATFQELEEALGFPLPKVARTDRTWWTSETKPHSRVWAAQGWRAGDLNPAAQTVVFRRALPTGQSDPIQPPAMKSAAEKASNAGRRRPWAMAAAVGGVGLLVSAGLAVARALSRRR